MTYTSVLSQLEYTLYYIYSFAALPSPTAVVMEQIIQCKKKKYCFSCGIIFVVKLSTCRVVHRLVDRLPTRCLQTIVSYQGANGGLK